MTDVGDDQPSGVRRAGLLRDPLQRRGVQRTRRDADDLPRQRLRVQVRRGGRFGGDLVVAAVADDAPFDRRTRRMIDQRQRQVQPVVDRRRTDADDPVAGADAVPIAAAAGRNRPDRDAAGPPVGGGDNAGHQSRFVAFDQHVDHRLDDLVDRDRERDLLGFFADRDVHPDHLAQHVQQRSAAVARVDAGADLNQVVVLERFVDRDLAVQGTDDALGRRVDVTERVADRDDFFADHQIVAVSADDRRQLLTGVDLHDGQIVVGPRRDQPRGRFAAVGQCRPQAPDAVDDVGVGDRITPRIDDHGGAHPGHAAGGGRPGVADVFLAVQIDDGR